MEDKLPKYTKNQQVGNRSATILKSVMQKFCIFTEIDQSQDLGIDFMGTVINNSYPTTYNFYAQCKGTDNIAVKLNSAGTAFSYSIDTKTINFWKQKKDTTFLFLVDEKNEYVYWCSPLHEIEGKDIINQNSYSFHIYKKNCISRNSSKLSEDFIFEIIRYYANFSEGLTNQLLKIQELSADISSQSHILELMEVLEQNFKNVSEKYQETINKLICRIKFDLERSLNYCCTLDQMEDIVRVYCPKGIFYTPFGTGTGSKTISECEQKINALISRKDATYKELYTLSKEIFELRGNLLGFLREMVYEDMPFSTHDDIDAEFEAWLKEAKGRGVC